MNRKCQRNMYKKYLLYIWILISFAIINACSCRLRDNTGPDCIDEINDYVPVAEDSDIVISSENNVVDYLLVDHKMFYLEVKGSGTENISSLKLCTEDGEAAEVLYQTTSEEPTILLFSRGIDGGWYFVSWLFDSNKEHRYFLQKLDSSFEEVYCHELNSEGIYLKKLNGLYAKYTKYHYNLHADHNGNVVLADDSGNVFLFDSEGEFIGRNTMEINFFDGCIVDGGESGCYLWESVPATRKMVLQKIDFKRGCVNQPEYIDLIDYIGAIESYNLLSGYERGLLFSTNIKLWNYDPIKGEMTEILKWDSDYVNIDGFDVQQIEFNKAYDRSKNNYEPMMTVYSSDVRSDEKEIFKIYYKDASEINEKKKVTLGLYWTMQANDWVTEFNKYSDEYKVEVKLYDNTNMLIEELLFDKENVPDILDVNLLPLDSLNSKGLLADLEPYFEKSEVVKKDDIIEQIWNCCTYQGKMTSIMRSFYFKTCISTAKKLNENGWTYDDFFALEEIYPESRPLFSYEAYSVWSFLKTSGIYNYVDWSERKCYYDSEQFRNLLKQLKSCNFEENDIKTYTNFDQMNWLLSGDYVLLEREYRSPQEYMEIYKEEYAEKIINVGYPTQEGKPYYIIESADHFAIFNESPNKEGAWAFLEFVLSEQNQDWYAENHYGFPVRKEAFEAYLQKPFEARESYEGTKVTEEAKQSLRNMLNNGYPAGKKNLGEIGNIIWEELQAFLEDAKTTEETIEIIQNRVQLYLDEM